MTFLKKIKFATHLLLGLETKMEKQSLRISSLLEQVEDLRNSNQTMTALMEEILYSLDTKEKEPASVAAPKEYLVQTKPSIDVN